MEIEFAGKSFSLTGFADSYCLIVSVYTIHGVFESLHTATMCQDVWG